MIKYLRLIAISLATWSCSSSTDELANYFEPTQIEELNSLTDFIVGELTNNCNGERTTCLRQFFNELEIVEYNIDLTTISKTKQTELFNSLSTETFNEIWTTCKGSRPNQNGRVNIETICPNMNGQFANFLKDYCSKLDRLSGYGEAFEQAGDFSPANYAQLVKNPKSFDFNSEAELLIISVQLLTLNSEDQIVESVPNSRSCCTTPPKK
ncbi:MAG: hypothetical protein ABJG41_02835 [Cyclobacteriaceae bacterium]